MSTREPDYRDLVENGFGLICIHDVSGVLEWVSPAIARLLGVEPTDMVGRNLADFLADADLRLLPDYLEQIRRQGASRGQIEAITRDGESRFLTFHNVLRRPEGGPPYVIGHGTDVTNLLGSQEELKTVMERERHVAAGANRFFEVSSNVICHLDLQQRLIRVNPSFERTLGYRLADVQDRKVTELLHPDDVQDTTETLERSLGADEPRRFENRMRHADGTYRVLEWECIPLEERGFIYTQALEVTEIRAREAELNRARIEADRANQAKSEFLANVSHEIRTPMNGILGMTDLALDTHLSRQQREYLEMVQGSALALLDVINSVLDFSKIEAGKLQMEEIDFTLRDTITGALRPLALTANQNGLELLYDEGPGIPERLRGDPGRLRQVLVNLVGNAVKFTEKGEVRVSMQLVRNDEDGVELAFEVSDTGIGIAADKLDHVFESFSQADGSTSRRFGGTGLGLSIASGIVRMMGGKIEVQSEEGAGSAFRFRACFDHSQQPARAPDLPSSVLKGRRVLVVDDNDTNRTILERVLARMEMACMSVSSGAEALAALSAAHDAGAPFDMAILDVLMPQMDGFQLAERIRAERRFDTLVLITLTSAGRPGDGALCEQLHIGSYLLKPITPTELRDAILLTVAREREAPREANLVTRHSLREAWESLRVLLVEDNKVNQRLALAILERLGHRVVLASNGREALEALETSDFDLVLMDIQMPEMGGIEATQRIRAREAEEGGHMPIVAMTAHAMAGDRERFLAEGMDEYISKPISQERLREVVRTLGGSGRREDQPGAEGSGRTVEGVPAEEAQAGEPAGAATHGAAPAFDRDELMERVESDPELLRTLVGVFKADRPNLMGDLEEAIAGGDAEAVTAVAHTIKGALSVFGAEPARALAEQIELTSRAGQVDGAAGLYARLGEAVQKTEDGLDALLAELA